MLRTCVLGCVGLLSLLGSINESHAGFISGLSNFSPGQETRAIDDRTYGWRFHVQEDVMVESLGYHFFSTNQVQWREHSVGIWDISGSLIGSGTVGIPNSSFTGFHYANVATPFALKSGTDYVIGTNLRENVDVFYFESSGSTFGSAIDGSASKSGIERVSFGSSLDLLFPNDQPNNVATEQGYYGPNFQYSIPRAEPVPEPSSMAIFAAGSILLFALGRRRQKRMVSSRLTVNR